MRLVLLGFGGAAHGNRQAGTSARSWQSSLEVLPDIVNVLCGDLMGWKDASAHCGIRPMRRPRRRPLFGTVYPEKDYDGM